MKILDLEESALLHDDEQKKNAISGVKNGCNTKYFSGKSQITYYLNVSFCLRLTWFKLYYIRNNGSR